MDPKIMKKTQDTLGKIIKKPPLTEKLLSKPPFRFLHDVITEVMRTTGFLKGLFPPDEMDSKNVTAKEAKIAFLQKVIDCVSIVSSESISARPNKIIAGHEPEHTNELLQVIAHCIRRKMSSSDAVEAVLSGKTKKHSGKSKPKEEKSSTSAKQSEHASDEREATRERKSKHDLSSERGKEKSSDPRRRSSRTRDKDESAEKEHEKEKKRREKKSRGAEEDSAKRQEDEKEDSRRQSAATNQSEEGAEETKQSMRGPRPASAKGQRRRPPPGSRSAKPEDDSDNESAPMSQTHVRPPSARPGAPRIKQRNDAMEDRIDSGGQQRRAAAIIVDKDSDSNDSDEDAQFVVEEEQVPLHDVASDPPISNGMHAGDSDEEHGGLVKKILETKKELEHSASHGMKKHTEIERSNVTSAQQKKERELVMKEIEQLRNSVQKLCQSVAPLAKIIDYIQEDMDAMQNELNFWKNENKQHAVRLQEEETVTQQSIEPLNHELQEIEQNISSYRNLMATTKANILRNDEKIRKMVVAVATRS